MASSIEAEKTNVNTGETSRDLNNKKNSIPTFLVTGLLDLSTISLSPVMSNSDAKNIWRRLNSIAESARPVNVMTELWTSFALGETAVRRQIADAELWRRVRLNEILTTQWTAMKMLCRRFKLAVIAVIQRAAIAARRQTHRDSQWSQIRTGIIKGTCIGLSLATINALFEWRWGVNAIEKCIWGPSATTEHKNVTYWILLGIEMEFIHMLRKWCFGPCWFEQ